MNLIRFYVFLKDKPYKIIGTVCLHNISRAYFQSCEIGYKFSSEYHRMGYATEAIWQCLSIAFLDLNLHKVFAMVNTNNTPSICLLDSIGFHNDGINRDYIKAHDKWQDHFIYSFLSNEL